MKCFNISVRKGDSKEFTLEIFDSNTQSLYMLDPEDLIVMTASRFGETIFRKELTADNQDEDGLIYIYFSSDETQELFAPDKLKYYIKIFFKNGEDETLIPPGGESAYLYVHEDGGNKND